MSNELFCGRIRAGGQVRVFSELAESLILRRFVHSFGQFRKNAGPTPSLIEPSDSARRESGGWSGGELSANHLHQAEWFLWQPPHCRESVPSRIPFPLELETSGVA